MMHPDTGKIIPLPFRMSFFVPMNVPIAAGMMLYGDTVRRQLFWQWFNQSYNAGLNYANRNATVESSANEVLYSYLSATTIACSVAWGLGRVVRSPRVQRLPKLALSTANVLVPFTAVAMAGAFNAFAMRYKETVDGITVTDHAGDKRGTSVTAGRQAVLQVALTRVALPIPVLLAPGAIIRGINAIPAIGRATSRSAVARIFLELSVIVPCLMFALPAAIAIFPQWSEVDATALEEQFHGLTDRYGNPVQKLYFNKGL